MAFQVESFPKQSPATVLSSVAAGVARAGTRGTAWLREAGWPTSFPVRPVRPLGAGRTEGESRPERRVRTRALVVGAGEVGRKLAESLEAEGRFEVIGFVDDAAQGMVASVAGEWPVLGRRENAAAVVERYGVEEVFIAYAPTWQQQLAERLLVKQPVGTREVAIQVVPSSYETMMRQGSLGSRDGIATLTLARGGGLLNAFAKRLFDFSVASAALALLAPVMALVAILIKRDSAGPVIFRQERVGEGGQLFTLYKFRTMVSDAEAATGPVLASGLKDQRLTRVGKWLRAFRIDELPQLWNVVRGEMSLVGPRPERPCFVREFTRRNASYGRRHAVKPGITGLAQVLGGYHTDARDKLRFDLYYVAQRSLWLDLVIAWKTVAVVLRPSR
jgi:exopolysaccharide biosynthesis polyprenyl glycosylphosphotransferase